MLNFIFPSSEDESNPSLSIDTLSFHLYPPTVWRYWMKYGRFNILALKLLDLVFEDFFLSRFFEIRLNLRLRFEIYITKFKQFFFGYAK